MPGSRTGTASEIDASGGDTGSSAVTVPSDCTAIVLTYCYWDSNANQGAPTFDMNGTETFEQPTQFTHHPDTGNENGTGIQVLRNPTTGSRTLNWDWGGSTGARTDGGEVVLTYVKDVDVSTLADLVGDADGTASTDTNETSLTLTTVSTDLVIAMGVRLDTSTNGGPNFVLDGTVYIADAVLNNNVYEASEVTAGASSTTINMTNEHFASMVAIALSESPNNLVFLPYHGDGQKRRNPLLRR